MLQPAASELNPEVVFVAFCDLCVSTEADLSSMEAAAQRAGLESFDFQLPIRRDVLKLKRRAAFRKHGFLLTAEHFVASEKKTPTAVLNAATLLAEPVSYDALLSQLVAKFGAPNRRDLVGLGVSFAAIAGSDNRPETYDDAHARHVRGDGDLLVISLNDVRTYAHVPSEAIAMSYTRWIR